MFVVWKGVGEVKGEISEPKELFRKIIFFIKREKKMRYLKG